ncbi:membrane-spanning 4-domains subfamily A member 8-like [Petaurus breviceps papuanus]|uniref:membrane-spanning 4-domains subfamily A member 8-like n=1 Tax=Petaurus breviceps papuanus TaxID=3040969 RepID=UPI0036DACD89
MSSSGPAVNTTFVVPPKVVSPPPPPAYPSQYPGNHPQVQIYPGYQTQMISPCEQEYMAHKIWKEGKVLGAIQILIGLMHIGFGAVLVPAIYGNYIAISFLSGYPFWGGISFIISGSLSVSAQEAPVNPCKINGSLGMNIVSAIFSVVGIILFITELSINWRNDVYCDPNIYYNYCHGVVSDSGKGISGTLLIFSMLEFVIACILSHSGCRILCCQPSQTISINALASERKPTENSDKELIDKERNCSEDFGISGEMFLLPCYWELLSEGSRGAQNPEGARPE